MLGWGKVKRSQYGCFACGLCYHVECFGFVHYGNQGYGENSKAVEAMKDKLVSNEAAKKKLDDAVNSNIVSDPKDVRY